MSIQVHQGRTLVRRGKMSSRFFGVDITALPARDARRRLAVAFVIDRSGSMAGAKLVDAAHAVLATLQAMQPDDQFCVVAYGDVGELIQSAGPVTPARIDAAVEALRKVDCVGATTLSEGWMAGCDALTRAIEPGQIGRIFLVTDGAPNRGITEASALAHRAHTLRGRGVSTATFGLGLDIDEVLLQVMADAGGGRYHFVEHSTRLAAAMTDELGSMIHLRSQRVRIRLRATRGVQVLPVGPYAIREGASGEWVVQIPDLAADSSFELPFRVDLPDGVLGEVYRVELKVEDADGELDTRWHSLMWRVARSAFVERQPRNPRLDRVVASRYAAMAQIHACSLNRKADYVGARQALASVSEMADWFGTEDPTGAVAQLRDDTERLAQPLSERDRKLIHARAAALARG